MNSLPKKFSSLKEIIDNKIDILIVQETKIDATFPQGLFVIPGYKVPFPKDRDINGDGNLVYVREDIPSRELKEFDLEDNIEGVFVEINLRKSKWLLLAALKQNVLTALAMHLITIAKSINLRKSK